jgi:hypothetical protein
VCVSLTLGIFFSFFKNFFGYFPPARLLYKEDELKKNLLLAARHIIHVVRVNLNDYGNAAELFDGDPHRPKAECIEILVRE